MRSVLSWGYWKNTNTPRWTAVLFPLLGSIAIALTTMYVSNVEFHNKEVQADIKAIEREGIEFQTYAGAFVSAVLDGKNTSEVRKVLMDNLSRQFAVAETLDGRAEEAVEKYRDSILALRTATEKVEGVLTMRPFWEAMSDLLVAKGEVLEQLRGELKSAL